MVEADVFNGSARDALKQQHPELSALRPKNDLTHHVTSQDHNATVADERFAMRMTLRTAYERPERVLSLGTVVAGPTGSFWLCVQPACDSVRIKDGKRRYPFVPLTVNPASFDLIVEDHGAAIRLKLSRKPSEIRHWTFSADKHVRAVVASGNPPCFRTTSRIGFRWIAQLNESHAVRAAQDVGAEQSRIGLAESDWLRRSI
jgi:hypothetical protein